MFEQYATDDYQKRGGSYPASDAPDTISASKNGLDFLFKNTTEEAASGWVKAFLKARDLKCSTVEAYQDGDYLNDWVAVSARI